jgi:SEC-C motif domain protein
MGGLQVGVGSGDKICGHDEAKREHLMSTPQAPCPCGTALPYAACCGLWHSGPLHLQAPDAQALMRSRYSAYVLGLHAYVLATWHASTRPSDLQPFDPTVQWLGLQVRRHVVLDAAHAVVEFVARNKLAGRATRLQETSRFVREGGRWFYVDGDSG